MKAKMFILVMVAVFSWTPMLQGQVCEPPSINYMLNADQRPTDPHVCRTIHYENGQWITVPCINGYAPEVRHCGNKTIYDYRGCWLVSRVQCKDHKPYVEEQVKEAPKPPQITESAQSFSEHDGNEWKSGVKKPPVITESLSAPEKALPPAPAKSFDKSPYEILPPLPKGMERPDKIKEPDMRIVPKYEKP